eukprot:11112852-Karenia_brevis.AAC.1
MWTCPGYVQKLVSDGYCLGSCIARSESQPSSKVIQAQQESEFVAIKCVEEQRRGRFSRKLRKELDITPIMSMMM